MKVKINSTTRQTRLRSSSSINSEVIFIIGIFFVILTISLGIIFYTFGFPEVKVKSNLRNFGFLNSPYRPIGEIKDFSNLFNVLNSQPGYSANHQSKYYFVEIIDLNCESCATLHQNNGKAKSSFEKLKDDYLDKGKFSYSWINYNTEQSISEYNALYCSLEQKPIKTLEIIKKFYSDYYINFNIENYKKYAADIDLDVEQLEKCTSENRYNNRIHRLSELSETLGTTMAEPSLIVVKFELQEVKSLSGTTQKRMVPAILNRIPLNKDYDKEIKPLVLDILQETKT
jgi:hypothetical protein